MVANYHIPDKPTKDNTIIFKYYFFDIIEQYIFNTVRCEVYFDKFHCNTLFLTTIITKSMREDSQIFTKEFYDN